MAVKFNDGTYGPGLEELHFPFWDRFPLLATRRENVLFNARAGDTRDGAVLTRADTNNPGITIPLKQKWEIWSMLFYYQAVAIRNDAAITAILNMVRDTIFNLNVESKDRLFEGQLGLYADGPRQIQHVPTAAGNNVPYGSQAYYLGKIDLKVPIILEQLTNWQVDFEHIALPAAAINGDFVMMYLDTHLFRMH